ncbi:MAG: hypothetical protein ACT6S0_21300 [Roseateles sp.]|uniref:hypothetical protein n=1 Tax=Roseateles sp. TaxID=1971397 RepID=UPI0040369FCA
MKTRENRRIAGQADFCLVRAFSVEINGARLRRHLSRLKERDSLTSRARRAATYARRSKPIKRA